MNAPRWLRRRRRARRWHQLRAARILVLRVQVADLRCKGDNLFASSQRWREQFVQERARNRMTRREFAAWEAERVQKVIDTEPARDVGPHAFNWAAWAKGYVSVLHEVARQ